MTALEAFARALFIGFAVVAAPVGAMALLTIERTLARGRGSGYATGAGIATADALYASMAAFGLTAASGMLVGARGWVGLVGGGFLVYLGVRAMLSRPASRAGASGRGAASAAAAYGSAVALTLANPQTILSFVAIFAGAGLASAGGGWDVPLATVTGVLAGSIAWWILLVTVVSALRDRVPEPALLWVTRVSGAAIVAFGGLAIWSGALALR